MTNEQIAKVCHEANRAYCAGLGDDSQLPWEEAPQWQKDSALSGVELHIKNPNLGPELSHETWAMVKRKAGWEYGPVKDADKKEHPCLVPFKKLPMEQQKKDELFAAIVKILKD
jgi:hypothetical protein